MTYSVLRTRAPPNPHPAPLRAALVLDRLPQPPELTGPLQFLALSFPS